MTERQVEVFNRVSFCSFIPSVVLILIQVIAVASSDLKRSKTFASRYSISSAYGSYQELADDKNVGKFSLY